mgnify:FL=1
MDFIIVITHTIIIMALMDTIAHSTLILTLDMDIWVTDTVMAAIMVMAAITTLTMDMETTILTITEIADIIIMDITAEIILMVEDMPMIQVV